MKTNYDELVDEIRKEIKFAQISSIVCIILSLILFCIWIFFFRNYQELQSTFFGVGAMFLGLSMGIELIRDELRKMIGEYEE